MITFGSKFIRDNSDTQLRWLPMDTERLFKENMSIPSKRKQLEQLDWNSNSILYDLNRYGFRGEIIEDCDLVALGCSFTMGIGVKQDSIWCSVVAKELNRSLTNLGSGGAGLDTVFRIADHWLPKLKPKHVLLLTPPGDRIEVFADEIPTIYSIEDHNKFGNRDWWATDINFELYNRRSLMAIELLCVQNQCKLTVIDSEENIKYLDRGRDLVHPGPLSHRHIANLFIDLIQKDF